MSKVIVGQVDTLPAGHRDAMHVPYVVVTICFDGFKGGQNVRFIDDKFDKVTKVKATAANRHGIIDPFIQGEIKVGSRVCVFLDPKVVSEKLTHHFEIDADGIKTSSAGSEAITLQMRVEELKEEVEKLEREKNRLENESEEYQDYLNDSCRGCY